MQNDRMRPIKKHSLLCRTKCLYILLIPCVLSDGGSVRGPAGDRGPVHEGSLTRESSRGGVQRWQQT